MYDVVKSMTEGNCKTRGSAFLVFEYMEHDLYGLISRRIMVDMAQIKCLMKQLLKGLDY